MWPQNDHNADQAPAGAAQDEGGGRDERRLAAAQPGHRLHAGLLHDSAVRAELLRGTDRLYRVDRDRLPQVDEQLLLGAGDVHQPGSQV